MRLAQCLLTSKAKQSTARALEISDASAVVTALMNAQQLILVIQQGSQNALSLKKHPCKSLRNSICPNSSYPECGVLSHFLMTRSRNFCFIISVFYFDCNFVSSQESRDKRWIVKHCEYVSFCFDFFFSQLV